MKLAAPESRIITTRAQLTPQRIALEKINDSTR